MDIMDKASMVMETRTYKLTGVEPILGSNPSDPDVRAKYIESKKPAAVTENESENTPDPRGDDGYGLTVFLLHPKTGGPMLYDYVVRGFLKEALLTLKDQHVAPKSKVDKYLFVSPRHIPLCDPATGAPITEPDGVFERTLRAMTMQGPRVTLAGSETVDRWQIVITLTLLSNQPGKKAEGKALTWEAVEAALDYGRLQGLGQFRNGGFGRFLWERGRGGLMMNHCHGCHQIA